MEKKTGKQIIQLIANDICKGINDAGHETSRGKSIKNDTLINFGAWGLTTPNSVATSFYNAFKKYMKIKDY